KDLAGSRRQSPVHLGFCSVCAAGFRISRVAKRATKKVAAKGPGRKKVSRKSEGDVVEYMVGATPTAQRGNGSAANLGFEQKLWQAADKLRNNLDAAEYNHVVLGLIFLKYNSDAFEEKHAALEADRKAGADPEGPDEYRAENI